MVTVNHTLQFELCTNVEICVLWNGNMADVTGVKIYKRWTVAQSHKLGIKEAKVKL